MEGDKLCVCRGNLGRWDRRVQSKAREGRKEGTGIPLLLCFLRLPVQCSVQGSLWEYILSLSSSLSLSFSLPPALPHSVCAGQRTTSCIIPHMLSTLFFGWLVGFVLRQGFSLVQSLLSRLGWLASEPPGILLSLSPQHWGYKHIPQCLAFVVLCFFIFYFLKQGLIMSFSLYRSSLH